MVLDLTENKGLIYGSEKADVPERMRFWGIFTIVNLGCVCPTFKETRHGHVPESEPQASACKSTIYGRMESPQGSLG